MSARHRETKLDLLAEAAREGGLAGRTFRVRGGCMAPLIADGDEVTLAAEGGPLLPGHVVLARAGGELLCHRLLAAAGEHCEVAGDADLRLDLLPPAGVLGRVAAIATPRFGGARLLLPARPSRLEAFLAAWQRWSCRERTRLPMPLEAWRRAWRTRLSEGCWRRAPPS